MSEPKEQLTPGHDSHPLHGYVACPGCDLLYPIKEVPFKQTALCTRCGAPLYPGGRMNVEKVLAFTVTAMILLIIANSYPILELQASGQSSQITFFQAVTNFADQGMWALAAIVFLTSIAGPFIRFSILLLVLGGVWLGYGTAVRKMAKLLHIDAHLAPWGMLEIYLLGLLVSMVKLKDLADIVPGVAFYAFCLLVVCIGIIRMIINRFHLWLMLDQLAVEPGK